MYQRWKTNKMHKKLIIVTLLLISISGYSQPKSFNVVKTGKGKKILYLPGFTTPGSIWNETIANLKGKHESLIISYAGFDGLPAIDTPWYPSIRRELILYIEKQKLSGLTIIAHSMGGNLAVEIAAALPGKVDKLVLVDAIPAMRELMMPGVPVSQIQYNNPYNNQMLNMADTPFNKMASSMAAYMTMNTKKVDLLTEWIIKADRKTYVYGYTDLLRLDLRDMLKEVKAKVLILGASFPSKEITLATFEKQYANLEKKTILIADSSRHFVMLDQPEWLYEQVNKFLKK